MFGIFLWEAHARKKPYSYYEDVFKLDKIKKGELRPSKLDEETHSCIPAMWKLMNLCWSQNVKDRPTMKQVYDVLNDMRNCEHYRPA